MCKTGGKGIASFQNRNLYQNLYCNWKNPMSYDVIFHRCPVDIHIHWWCSASLNSMLLWQGQHLLRAITVMLGFQDDPGGMICFDEVRLNLGEI